MLLLLFFFSQGLKHAHYIVVGISSVHAYLKGSHAELDTEAQINVEVVRQEIEEHVVSAKQRDEEEGGLSQASDGQKERNKQREGAGGEATSVRRTFSLNAASSSVTREDVLITGCRSKGDWDIVRHSALGFSS